MNGNTADAGVEEIAGAVQVINGLFGDSHHDIAGMTCITSDPDRRPAKMDGDV